MIDRRWLYAGIALAAGVGLVRVMSKRIKPGSTRMLLVGDSLAVGLTAPLASLAKENQVQFMAVAKTGTRIDQWANSQTLKDALEKFRPTLVLVSLGTNDEYMTGDGGARQAPFLEKLLQLVRYPLPDSYGLADVVWIGPPTLPKSGSNGVIPLLRKMIPDGDYFPSQTLEIPRGPDKLHPTAKGYAGWAGALWQWLS